MRPRCRWTMILLRGCNHPPHPTFSSCGCGGSVGALRYHVSLLCYSRPSQALVSLSITHRAVSSSSPHHHHHRPWFLTHLPARVVSVFHCTMIAVAPPYPSSVVFRVRTHTLLVLTRYCIRLMPALLGPPRTCVLWWSSARADAEAGHRCRDSAAGEEVMREGGTAVPPNWLSRAGEGGDVKDAGET
ncbi:hypothetical protein FKP32DRAFT_443540 [Trametes sanguinea]|nr:hypothetical protein FKP32DRAFT_443540 [Trametes sanguinea]